MSGVVISTGAPFLCFFPSVTDPVSPPSPVPHIPCFRSLLGSSVRVCACACFIYVCIFVGRFDI